MFLLQHFQHRGFIFSGFNFGFIFVFYLFSLKSTTTISFHVWVKLHTHHKGRLISIHSLQISLGFRFDFDQKKKDLQSAIDASLQEADGLMDGWVERSFF